MRLQNPLSFTPLPVTILTAAVYVILIASLLVEHYTLPRPRPIEGIDLNLAWHDLQTISNGFHPFNSHRNDEIRIWLLEKLDSIVQTNQKSSLHVQSIDEYSLSDSSPDTSRSKQGPLRIFNDVVSNASTASNSTFGRPGYSTYFESTNIIVYIRGSEDDPTEWWLNKRKPEGSGGVLMNAHYDSVSTGYGATDDGVGIVTILQLVQYFTSPGKQPKRGIVALFNNGEEDFLNGARAFAQHPLSKFPTTFLNLEGAGAGGKAVLFRSSNTEVTQSYRRTKHPYGNVIGADGFNRGLVQSQTDYVIFEHLGMQGLDVAFYEPRARYHTNRDNTKHTSKASLYHMLSTSLAAVEGLTDAPVINVKGSDSVWFYLFVSAFALFRLHTLFAL